jgi:outer membrane lipoprotein-sorting protein
LILVALLMALAVVPDGRASMTQEMPLEQLLTRVQTRYQSLDSMSARFEQRTENRLGVPQIATGQWQMRSPGKMRVVYDQTGRVLVTDGENLFWYLPEDKQVHVRSQDEFAQRGNALLYLSGQGDLRRDFAVAGIEWRTKLAPANIQIRLEPLVDGTNYAYLILEIEPDAAMIVRLVSFGLFGEPNEFRFTEIEVDADLADDLFQFTIPPDVSIETLGN